MANTTRVTLTDAVWTEIADSSSGFITIEGANKVLYRENDVLPAAGDITAHTMERETGAFVSFALEAGQKVYMRSAVGVSIIAITIE